MNVEIVTVAAQFLFWEYICFQFSVLVLCSAESQGLRIRIRMDPH